jgi:hypothetical protein
METSRRWPFWAPYRRSELTATAGGVRGVTLFVHCGAGRRRCGGARCDGRVGGGRDGEVGVPEELLFTVDGTSATPARRISLAEANLLERKHLQQWVIDHPELLGAGIKVVTFEFGR